RRIPGCAQDLDLGRACLGPRHQHCARKRNCRMSAAIELRGVEKSFGNVAIIRDVNLNVAQGERHALIGPNGAGKSTTFNLISGYMAPTSGTVLMRGEVISGFLPTRSIGAGCRAVFKATTFFPIRTGGRTRPARGRGPPASP